MGVKGLKYFGLEGIWTEMISNQVNQCLCTLIY